jgi:hypothetical protein
MNGLYEAPGGIIPTVDDIRNGITTNTNKGTYETIILALKTLQPLKKAPKKSVSSK